MSRKRPAAGMGLSEYESKRQKNISDNAAVMRELGLQPLVPTSRRANRESRAAAAAADAPAAAIARPGARLSSASLWDTAEPAALPAPSKAERFVHESDVVCSACGGGDDEEGNELLICEHVGFKTPPGCSHGCHQFCHQPPLRSVPRRRWLCPHCSGRPVVPAARSTSGSSSECEVASSSSTASSASTDAAPAPWQGDAADAAGDEPLAEAPAPVMEAAEEAAEEAAMEARAAPAGDVEEEDDEEDLPLSLRLGMAGGGKASGSPPAREAVACETLCTPGSRAWCAARRALLQRARAALHLASIPLSLLCREEQLREVHCFTTAKLGEGQGGALYVSGNPGLGKSLTIRQAYERLVASLPAQHALAFINAFHLASPSAVYATLLTELGGSEDGAQPARSSEAEARAAFEAFIMREDRNETAGAKAKAKAKATKGGKATAVSSPAAVVSSPLPAASSAAVDSGESGGPRRSSRGENGRGHPSSRCSPSAPSPTGHTLVADCHDAAVKGHAKASPPHATGGGGSLAARGMCVVVLDEIDQLLTRHQAVLYTLFQLAAAPRSRLILIGVANALDLTDRFLPRLAARGASPTTLQFAPYAPPELSSIILQRVEQTESEEGARRQAVATADGSAPPAAAYHLIDRMAATFCAKKVAASSGDARRALEVCRVAADKALEELHQYEAKSFAEVAMPPPPPRSSSSSAAAAARHGPLPPSSSSSSTISSAAVAPPAWASKPPLRFEHMKDALSTAFTSATVTLLASLPQHQQLVLCGMIKRMRRLRKEADEAAEAAAKAARELAEASALAAAAAQAVADAAAEEAAAEADEDGVARPGSAKALKATAPPSANATAQSKSAERAARAAALAAAAAAGHERCSIGTLADEYSGLCARQRLPALSRTEVMALCESLAVCSLLAISGSSTGGGRGKSNAMSRSVWLCISDDDLKLATEQVNLFRQLLR